MSDNFILVQEENHNTQARWDHETIVFSSREDAEEFASLFPGFFGKTLCGTIPIDLDLFNAPYIKYEDLVNKESFKKAIEQIAN